MPQTTPSEPRKPALTDLLLRDILHAKRAFWSLPGLVAVNPEDTLVRAVQLLHVHNISQLPVLNDGVSVGQIRERTVLEALHRKVDLRRNRVATIMEPPLPELPPVATYANAFERLKDQSAVLVVDGERRVAGILNQADLIAMWLHPSLDDYAI